MPSYQIQHLKCQCTVNVFEIQNLYTLYIYWCVNINIYICTLIHGHVSETFRALFRGFGPQNGLFWPMTRSCLVKLLIHQIEKSQTAKSASILQRHHENIWFFLRCNTQETPKNVGFPMMRKLT